jgi:hypothetical protein
MLKIKTKVTLEFTSQPIIQTSVFFIWLILISFTLGCTSYNAFAQHHGAAPPLATLGDRNIIMNFDTNPKALTAGQSIQLNMNLTDDNSGEKIQHVTYRVTVSQENQTKISDFFHSHLGELTILAKNTPSSQISVGGTFDVLTNAFVPDPSGKITINGPLFSETDANEIDIEITTIDNDKTDLEEPLQFHFIVNNNNSSSSSSSPTN